MTAVDRPNDAVAAALQSKGLQVTRVIGHGGNSVVYRAQDTRLAREVAVKVIDSTKANAAALSRFQREVTVVARLRHPHILPVFDAGVASDGSIFAVMPLASGQTLRELLRSGPLPLRTVVALVREIADALAYAHSQGIIHRDIKPENILMEHEHAVVADFGLALQGGERVSELRTTAWLESLTDERLTASGSFVGTPLYASPEQVSGGDSIDARSDIFSLGAVCYEMLTGVPPFQGKTVQDTLTARFRGPPLPMSDHNVRIPAPVEAVVVSALKKLPEERPRTASDFRDALVSAYRASATPHITQRVAAAGVVLLVLGVALGVIAPLWRNRAAIRALDPQRVVVADFDNETADSAFAEWGDVAGDLIATRLAQVPGLHVVSSERWLARSQQVQRQRDARSSLRDVATETNAAFVLSGGYYRNARRIDLILEVTDARSGDLLRTFGPVSVSPAAPDSTVLALGTRVAAVLDSVVRHPTKKVT